MTAPATLKLFQLPADVSHLLVALLEPEELNQLASVCRAAVASTVLNAPIHKSLILPPAEETRARRLLAGLHQRDPSRLGAFKAIQIARPWQVDLLLEEWLRDSVRSIRVCTEIDNSPEAIGAICHKLAQFSNLTKLDFSETPIRDVTGLAALVQLRSLNMSRTEVTDVSPLATLFNLEELVLRDSRVSDMRWIETLTQLQCVEVTSGLWERIAFPSFRWLTNLEKLHVSTLSIESEADFLGSIQHNLKHLAVNLVYDRSSPAMTDEETWNYASIHPMLSCLPQLESLDDGYDEDSERALKYSRPTLRALGRTIPTIDGAFPALAAMTHLEEMSLVIPSIVPFAGVESYSFLKDLSRLKIVHVFQHRELSSNKVANSEAIAVLLALSELPQLERLHIKFWINAETSVARVWRFAQLKHLRVHLVWDVKTMEWLSACTSLRSLVLDVKMDTTDVSAIGSLHQLEELTLQDSTNLHRGHTNMRFLAHLTRLKLLVIKAFVRELPELQGLVKLEELTISSSCLNHHRWAAHVIANCEVLGGLPLLRKVNIRNTRITDLTPLKDLQFLRSLVIPIDADCRPLADGKHPRLLRILHPDHNCLWSCDRR